MDKQKLKFVNDFYCTDEMIIEYYNKLNELGFKYQPKLNSYSYNYISGHMQELNSEYVKLMKWDNRFLSLASHIATWSKDPSTKVGAIITKDNIIVSTGYNGFPQKMSDDLDLYLNREEKYSRVVHGEINAILFAQREVKDCTLYTWPFAPCDRCCVICIQAGISHFVFPKTSEDLSIRWGAALEKSKSFMREAGCTFTELEISEIQ